MLDRDYESPASELLIDITPNMSLYTIQPVTSIDGRNMLTSSPAYYLHSALLLLVTQLLHKWRFLWLF